MSPRRQIVVLSPHPDDAAFSVGGILARVQDASITVVTCFSRSCRHHRDDSMATTSTRSMEDDAYARHLGTQVIRLCLPDSGLRTNVGREELSAASEIRLRNELHDLLRPLLDSVTEPVLFVPLGIGEHPDHIHCRDLACDAFDDLAMVFYEDLPYGHMVGGPIRVHGMVREQFPNLKDYLLPLTCEQMERKLEGMDYYTSQLHPSWRAGISSYGRELGLRPGACGERYWVSDQQQATLRKWTYR